MAVFLDFLLIWAVPIFFLIFLIVAFATNDSKSFGKSTVSMLASAALAGVYFWSDITSFLTAHGTTTTVFYLAVIYVVAAVITAFIYWIFYNWKAKERFDRLLLQKDVDYDWGREMPEDFKLSLRKYLVIKDTYKRRDIFDDHDGYLNINVEDLNLDIHRLPVATKEELDAEVAKVLPPRFSACKFFIVGAGCSWPITLIWLLISRVIKQLIERIISTFGGTFDKISAITFGKF